MFRFKVEHSSGFKVCRTFDAAVAEYTRRTKGGNSAFIRVVWC